MPDYIEKDGVKFWGTWAGRPLHLMEKDELCQIIVNLNRKLQAQSEEHMRQLDVLAPTKR
jgi:hypothetical protein